jgi:hypothetical protein
VRRKAGRCRPTLSSSGTYAGHLLLAWFIFDSQRFSISARVRMVDFVDMNTSK